MLKMLVILVFLASCGKSEETSGESITCPQGFTLVPRNSDYVASAFCVSTYEMKNDGSGNAVSHATSLPWVSINRANAITECQALGTDYDLISNIHWQVIARNIELVAANWSGLSVGSGYLNEGHSDEVPAASLAIADTANDFSGTGETSGDQKRTHVLSTGEKIWDFSGNVWEWVKDDNDVNYGADAFFSQVTTLSHTTTGTLDDGQARVLKAQFGPAGDYTSLNATPFGHLGRAMTTAGTLGGIFRGGSYVNALTNSATNEEGGIFSALTKYAATSTFTTGGFRCVYAP